MPASGFSAVFTRSPSTSYVSTRLRVPDGPPSASTTVSTTVATTPRFAASAA